MIHPNFTKLLTSLLGLAFCAAALAEPSSDELSTCLANSTTGRDRINLAKWMYAAMSAHPEVSKVSQVSPATLEEINKTNAALITRLLVTDCNNEVKQTMKLENAEAFRLAFESLGKLAMTELMGNPKVAAGFTSGIEMYIDKEKLKKAFE